MRLHDRVLDAPICTVVTIVDETGWGGLVTVGIGPVNDRCLAPTAFDDDHGCDRRGPGSLTHADRLSEKTGGSRAAIRLVMSCI